MNKIFQSLFALTGAAMIIAGCAKEIKAPVEELEGELQSVTFTATMDNGTVTRAAADGDGAAASVNRCIMEIYYDGSLFARDIQPVTHGTTITATFTAQVVTNRTYTVAFWADSVAAASSTPTTEELAQDLYYTTNADGGLQAIALKDSTAYIGNNDARDAFFAVKSDCTVAQAGTSFDITLKRPFAQINVITTDWDKADKVSNLKPTSVNVTIKNPLTAFNALTGVASTTVSTLTYNAGIYTSPTSGTDATLSMDYLFASADKAVIDIDWEAGQGTDASTVSHSFTNIPYQRNYRTNIKGNLLTSQGQWTVTVDPVWDGEHSQIVEVKDIQSANAAILANASSSTIDVKFSAEPDDSGVPTGTESSTARAILTTAVAEGATLSIEVASETNALYVGDYEHDYDVTTMATSTTPQAATVNINVPSTGSIGTLVINAPSKTVYINGKQVASVGTITNLDAITSDNTLVIEANQTVTNLIVRQGALEIHGTVSTATVTVAEGEHVYVRDCEGLSQSVYDVLKPYIDVDNGYTGEQESGKETYRIYQDEAAAVAKIGEKKYYKLSAAFAQVTEGQTIELLKSCDLTATATIDNSVTLDLKTYTLTAACSGYAFDLNTTTTGKTFKIIGTDADNCGHIISNGTEGHSGVACINANSAAVTFEMDYVKVHGANENDVYNAANFIICDCSAEKADHISLTGVSIKAVTDLVSGSQDGRAYASINVKGGVYSTTTRGFRFCGAADSESVIDGADITTEGGIAVYDFSVATLKNSTISMTSGSNNDAVACSRKCNNNAVLTVENTAVTVKEGTSSTKPASAIAAENDGVVIVKSGTFENKNAASTYVIKISTSGGYIDFQGGTVNAQDGQTTMFANTQSKHDDENNPSKVKISGGTIYGNCGVSSDYAQVEIAGGTFMSPITLHIQNSQHVSILEGCTAVFEDKVTSTQTTAVTIPAGTFKKAIVSGDLKEGSTISGGTFHEAAPYSGYIKSGYEAKAQGTTPETWKVVEKENVISVSSLLDLNTKLEDNTSAGKYIYELPAGTFSDTTITIKQREGVSVILRGSESGVTTLGQANIVIDGMGGYGRAETVTVKNITFDYTNYTTGTEADIIYTTPNSASSHNAQPHNITIDGCTFNGNSGNKSNIVAIKVPTGLDGCTNLTIKDCTAENVHSLAQLESTYGVAITGCTLNSGRGVNLQGSTNIVISDNTWTISDYVIRAGQSSTAGKNNTTMKIYGNTFTKTSKEDDGCLVLRYDCPTDITFCDNKITYSYDSGNKYDVVNKKNLDADTEVKTDKTDITYNDLSKLTITKGTWDESTKTFTPSN